ncbi:NAD(P)H-dependent oxidoreductase [Ginsengibacter hankyongi]|uniref:NAD(P)H-dependent oxidoreductase n=1 Tax=Ginsengibacter hankyongi TaxID=2607284 RepID=A0A5J5IK00_9BACT|nr:NAD(P)H-dependent oxidoreductase [Ginsengibacter hankyongi]KAA9041131.1 NAD(P)H-dependent oxidoreductase [Ginsengibacter hankyongi]
MYTIISGTNRPASHTGKVAIEYQRLLKEKNIDAGIFSLIDLDVLKRTPEFLKIENEILIPTQKFIFILPEYNGTFPGVLKAMIDNSDVKKVWYYKKALLTGVSTGRAGNLRGMDHLSASLHYLKMNVHHNKLPISVIDKVMDKDGRLNEETLKVIDEQLTEFINY